MIQSVSAAFHLQTTSCMVPYTDWLPPPVLGLSPLVLSAYRKVLKFKDVLRSLDLLPLLLLPGMLITSFSLSHSHEGGIPWIP